MRRVGTRVDVAVPEHVLRFHPEAWSSDPFPDHAEWPFEAMRGTEAHRQLHRKGHRWQLARMVWTRAHGWPYGDQAHDIAAASDERRRVHAQVCGCGS